MALGVGIDLVDPEEVSAALAAHGERYLARVFTDVEQRDSGSDARRLAARFAAKEATVKALGWRGEALPWRSIGVARDERGRASICLSGPAAELAERRGVRRLDLSFTHRRSMAAAIVLAEIG